MNFKDLFQSKFKVAYESYLDDYLEFCKSNDVGKKIKNITEAHHVLPKNSKAFPEYIKTQENIVHLKIEDHIRAHILLYRAIPSIENSASVVRTLGNIPRDKFQEDEFVNLAAYARRTHHEFMNSDRNPNIGSKRSEEARKNLRLGQLNRAYESFVRDRFVWITDGVNSIFHEAINPIPEGWSLGRGLNTTSKISEANTGKVQSKATIAKRSEAMKKLGDRHHTKSSEFRIERSNKWKENNPSKSEENRRRSSERMKMKASDPDYLRRLSDIGKKNLGKIQIYDTLTKKFSRALPDKIPEGCINASGLWEWQFVDGKRYRVMKHDI